MSKQKAEAEACIKKAEKYLKTSIIALKFSPDHDSAAAEYTRAGVCYKNARMFKECADVYEEAAKCHDQCKHMFHSAKCKEEAAKACRDMNDLDRAKRLMQEAGHQYAESGSPETSAQALQKAANFFEGLDDEKAIEFYLRAYEIVSETDRTKQCSEFLGKLTKLYLKKENWTEAIKTISEEIKIYINEGAGGKVGMLSCALVLVVLKTGDSVQATKLLSNSCNVAGFRESYEAQTCQTLIDAFENGEAKKFQSILSRPLFKTMDNEYLRIMQTLTPPKTVPENDGEEMNEEDMDFR